MLRINFRFDNERTIVNKCYELILGLTIYIDIIG